MILFVSASWPQAQLQLEAIKTSAHTVSQQPVFLLCEQLLDGPERPVVELLLRVLVKHPWRARERERADGAGARHSNAGAHRHHPARGSLFVEFCLFAPPTCSFFSLLSFSSSFWLDFVPVAVEIANKTFLHLHGPLARFAVTLDGS